MLSQAQETTIQQIWQRKLSLPHLRCALRLTSRQVMRWLQVQVHIILNLALRKKTLVMSKSERVHATLVVYQVALQFLVPDNTQSVALTMVLPSVLVLLTGRVLAALPRIPLAPAIIRCRPILQISRSTLCQTGKTTSDTYEPLIFTQYFPYN